MILTLHSTTPTNTPSTCSSKENTTGQLCQYALQLCINLPSSVDELRFLLLSTLGAGN